MSRLDTLPDRALQLASNMGDSLRNAVPSNAGHWLGAGAKLGAAKGGLRVAGFFVRRHPLLLAATAAGAGLLWYSARKRAKEAENGTIEGSSRRVEARRSGTARGRKTAARRAGSTPSADR